MASKPVILVVDDDPDIRKVMRWSLSSLGYDLLEAASGQAGVTIAREQNPDAILLDVMLPEMTGLEVARELAGDPTLAEIPVLFLSALDDLKTKAAGFALGGHDYLTKPADPREIDMRLKAAIAQRRRLQATQERAAWLEAEREKLWQQAMIDPLTGLGNRRLLEQRTAALFRGGPSVVHLAALLMIDLNGFKRVNDTWGHAVGDQVLKAAAERIRQELPDADVHVRLGGDEFVVVLNWVEHADLCATGDRLRAALEEILVPVGEHVVRVSAGVGSACYPKDGESLEALLQVADERLYADKARSAQRRVDLRFRKEA